MISSQWLPNGNDIWYSTGNVGIGTSAPAVSALLDVASTTKGFLPPRMTTTQRDAITSPVAGVTIYNTTYNTTECYHAAAWYSDNTTAFASCVGYGNGNTSMIIYNQGVTPTSYAADLARAYICICNFFLTILFPVATKSNFGV